MNAIQSALVVDHLRIAEVIAQQLRRGLPPAFELEDLLQIGRLGLIEAAASWDPRRGVPFAAYARFRVRGAILDAVKRRNYLYARHGELDDRRAEEPSPLDLAIDRQRHHRIRAALKEVGVTERQVLEQRGNPRLRNRQLWRSELARQLEGLRP